LQSAVSPNCIRQGVRQPEAPWNLERLADYKSALQQIAILRYASLAAPCAVAVLSARDSGGKKPAH